MAPLVATRTQIVAAMPSNAILMDAMVEAFGKYSAGSAWVSPVTHVSIPPRDRNDGGDACIKCGYIKDDPRWVVKIASGFGANQAEYGVSNSQGVMLLFSQLTGACEAVLADDGYLTDLRTAAAAAMCARALAPLGCEVVAVYGTGVIARLVVQLLAPTYGPSAKLLVVSRSADAGEAFKRSLGDQWASGDIELSKESGEADLVFSCTPATEPVVHRLKKGALLVALGADGAGKRELAADVVRAADVVLADSHQQCISFGECASAISDGVLSSSDVIEIGDYLRLPWQRAGKDRTIIVDLTGVAVQDVAIASIAFDAIRYEHPAESASPGLL